MHGGTVQAFSKGSGQGSEFTVRLPLSGEEQTFAAETANARQASSAHGPSRRVLVVDDNQDVANSFAVVLSSLGHEVQTVYDGQAALEAVNRFAPEVVFLDIGLPGMDGYTVARRLRKTHQNSLMLVALTGYGQEKDIQRAKAAGFDHHILKPVTQDVLETLLD
jgi:CheY-like chemotaxis protein